MLYTKTLENTDAAVIHTDRDSQMEFSHWPPQHLAHLLIKAQQIRNMIELLLSHCKCICCF
jgi:hypothetical protein